MGGGGAGGTRTGLEGRGHTPRGWLVGVGWGSGTMEGRRPRAGSLEAGAGPAGAAVVDIVTQWPWFIRSLRSSAATGDQGHTILSALLRSGEGR